MVGRRRGRSAAHGPSTSDPSAGPAAEPDVEPVNDRGAIESKRDVLHDSLVRFYADPARFQQFKAVVCNEAGISLRVLDFLVTNFAKTRSLFLVHDGRPFNVFVEYRAQLKGFSKRYFDPFCRREHTRFRGIDTTLGQLNFFRWAIQTGVLEYALAREAEIEGDMMDAIRRRMKESAAKPLASKAGAAHKPRNEVFVKTPVRTTLKF